MTFLGLPLPAVATTLRSGVDHSVNFVTPLGAGEALEARFVRRGPDYIVCYVSPQTGCAQACRFCHLTASGQVRGRDATVSELLEQAASVLDFFDHEVRAGRQEPTGRVHFNFMARGDALASQTILDHGDEVVLGLEDLGRRRALMPLVKMSTIGPAVAPELATVFATTRPDLYYSLYSLDPVFRRRWMPNAGDPEAFLAQLAERQRYTRQVPVLHHAVIAGENSDPSHAHGIVEAVNRHGLRVDVNIVRYNPPSGRHGAEADDLLLGAHRDIYTAAWPHASVRLIPRVGFDVAASCGMFVGGRTPAGARTEHAR